MTMGERRKDIQTKKVVVASGYFNPLHRGHIDLLEAAAKLGDQLVVIINNDHQVTVKGSMPFMQAPERAYIVNALACVDKVIISEDKDTTVCKTLERINPAIFANGGDRKDSNDIPEAKVCERLGIEMIFNVGGKKVQSSSNLLHRLPCNR